MAGTNVTLVKKSLNQWMDYEKQIEVLKNQKKQVLVQSRALHTQIKDLVSKQEQIQEPVFQYMTSINAESLQINNGQATVRHKFTQPTKGITKAVIRTRIEEYFGNRDPDVIEPLYNYIVDPTARKGEPKSSLKLKVKKPPKK